MREEKRRLTLFELKCLKGITGVDAVVVISYYDVRVRTGIVRALKDCVASRVLMWVEHMERMDEERLKRVMKAEMCQCWLRKSEVWLGG